MRCWEAVARRRRRTSVDHLARAAEPVARVNDRLAPSGAHLLKDLLPQNAVLLVTGRVVGSSGAWAGLSVSAGREAEVYRGRGRQATHPRRPSALETASSFSRLARSTLVGRAPLMSASSSSTASRCSKHEAAVGRKITHVASSSRPLPLRPAAAAVRSPFAPEQPARVDPLPEGSPTDWRLLGSRPALAGGGRSDGWTSRGAGGCGVAPRELAAGTAGYCWLAEPKRAAGAAFGVDAADEEAAVLRDENWMGGRDLGQLNELGRLRGEGRVRSRGDG